jgi:AraC family transcriptional regulator
MVPPISSHAIMVNIGSPFRLEERLDGRLYTTFGNKGDIAIVPAGRPIEFSAQKPQEVESFIMHLDSAFVHGIAEAEGLNPEDIELVGSVGGRDPKLEQLGLSLLSELENEDAFGGLYAESLATLLAVHLLRSHSSLGLSSTRKTEQEPAGALSGAALGRVTDYIEGNLAETLTLSEISGVAHMSPFHFSRVFKLATGLSPHRYVIGRRVERAKDLLTNTNLPLHEVARLSGFSDQSHLAKHTRRLLGAAPRSLRLASG